MQRRVTLFTKRKSLSLSSVRMEGRMSMFDACSATTRPPTPPSFAGGSGSQNSKNSALINGALDALGTGIKLSAAFRCISDDSRGGCTAQAIHNSQPNP